MATREEMIEFLEANKVKERAPPKEPSREENEEFLLGKEKEEPSALESLGEGTLKAVSAIGSAVDRFTGAPIRKGIGELQSGKGLLSAGGAALEQIGADPETAPTGKEIAQKGGAPDTALSEVLPSLYSETGEGIKLKRGGLLDPTASGAIGLGVDILADPTNFIPGKAILGAAGRGLKTGAKIATEGALGASKGILRASDVATGMKAGEGVIKGAEIIKDVGGKIYKSAANALEGVFSPKRASSYDDAVRIAKKHGIDPKYISSAQEFGPQSFINRYERVLREGASGEDLFEEFSKGLTHVTDKTEEFVTKAFGDTPKTRAEAGELLEAAFKKHTDDVFKDADLTYRSAAKKFPGLEFDKEAMNAVMSKAVGMEREAARLLRTSADPIQKAQAQNLIEWANKIKSSKGSYKEMTEIVQNLGRAAYGKQIVGQIPSDVKKLRELYKVGSEGAIHSIRKVDEAAADLLTVNNKEIADFLGDKSTLGKILETSKNPESVYNNLIESGGSSQIKVLKDRLPKADYDKLRGSYLRDKIKYNSDGTINFRVTKNNLNQKGVKERLNYLFEPNEIEDFSELIKFGDDYGIPVMSTSGTGASSSFKDLGANITKAGMGRKYLDWAKAKSRGKGLGVIDDTVNISLPSKKKGLLGRERGKIEKRLKAAQSIAPSQYGEEENE